MTDTLPLLRIEGTICGGLCWEQLTRSRWLNPKSLERCGYKVYSQNDEDGIIQEIFRRIGTTDSGQPRKQLPLPAT